MEMFREHLVKFDCKIMKSLRNKIDEWHKNKDLNVNLMIDRFNLNGSMKNFICLVHQYVFAS
jgi:hypothetical protein